MNNNDKTIGVYGLSGFTLIELLVAIAVFAIMSVMAYGGLSNVIANSQQSQQALQRLRDVQHTMLNIHRDLSQLVKRDIRDQLGDPRSFLSSVADIDLLVEFTRGGRRNPAELKRSHLQRIAYKLEDDKLIRMYWPQLDRVQVTEPYETVMLEDVENAGLRFLDDNNEWHEQWPPITITATAGAQVPAPKAIEFTMTLSDWGDLVRLVRVDL